MHTMYLTDEERRDFDALPEDVREGWEGNIETETIDAYESAELLEQRSEQTTLPSDVRELAQQVSDKISIGDDIGDLSLDDLSDKAFLTLMWLIGATGITALIETMLPAATGESIEGIAHLTDLRHRILLANSHSPAVLA